MKPLMTIAEIRARYTDPLKGPKYLTPACSKPAVVQADIHQLLKLHEQERRDLRCLLREFVRCAEANLIPAGRTTEEARSYLEESDGQDR